MGPAFRSTSGGWITGPAFVSATSSASTHGRTPGKSSAIRKIVGSLRIQFDLIAEKDPPAITHPAFFYGFVGVALVWQITFAIIARDPVRFRTIMIPAVLEKLVYSIPVIVLVLQKRTRPADLLFAAIDLSLGVLFVIAYLRTPRSVLRSSPS